MTEIQQPKVFGVKFILREIRRIFLIKLRNFEHWKIPKLLNFRFLEGWYLLILTILKKILYFFFCFRTASLGGIGLITWQIPTYSKKHVLYIRILTEHE